MKFLFFLLLGYFAYRYFIKPLIPSFPPHNEQNKVPFNEQKSAKKVDESDYIDYEEID